MLLVSELSVGLGEDCNGVCCVLLVSELSVGLEEEDEEIEKAREQLYKEIGYVENEDLKYPKEVSGVLGQTVPGQRDLSGQRDFLELSGFFRTQRDL